MPRLVVEGISDGFRQNIAARIKAIGFSPLLVGFLANHDEAAKKYAEWTEKACTGDGIKFELRVCEPCELEQKIKEANMDDSVHGILIYYPCFGSQPSFFGGKMDDYLRDLVRAEKDVEGLCFTYRWNLYHDVRFIKNLDGTDTDKKCLLPCTPLAVVKILESLGVYDGDNGLQGKTVTIINRSDIVGRPLSAMLANDGATVYSVDIDSIFIMKNKQMIPVPEGFHLSDAIKLSNIIITGVPTKTFKLDAQLVNPGTVIINVSNFKNVVEKELHKVPGVKYVPQVGKVTIAMLERNLFRLIENFHLPKCKLIEPGGRIDPQTF